MRWTIDKVFDIAMKRAGVNNMKQLADLMKENRASLKLIREGKRRAPDRILIKLSKITGLRPELIWTLSIAASTHSELTRKVMNWNLSKMIDSRFMTKNGADIEKQQNEDGQKSTANFRACEHDLTVR